MLEWILDPHTERLRVALAQLRHIPGDLGEVCQLVYAFIRKGGKLARLRPVDRRGRSAHAIVAAVEVRRVPLRPACPHSQLAADLAAVRNQLPALASQEMVISSGLRGLPR